jgi:hypothetical protein
MAGAADRRDQHLLPDDVRLGVLVASALLLAAAAAAQAGTDDGSGVIEARCGGSDDTALVAGVLARLARGPAARALIHGHCAIAGAVPELAFAGRGVTLSGDGPEATVLTFTGDTDGLRVRLARDADGWGSFTARDFTIARGPTNPVRAHTGLLVYADPAAHSAYIGYSSFSDLVIRGDFARTTQWQHGMVLSGLTSASLRNINIQAPGAGPADQGDVQLTLDGPNRDMFATSTAISNSTFQGGSVGIAVTGYVQGVFCANCTVIGQYDSVRWIGAGAPMAHETDRPTNAGRTLHTAAGGLAGVTPGDIVNGPGIAPQSRVAGVDATKGMLVIDPPVQRPLPAGTRFTTRAYLIAEDFGMTTSTLNASHRDVLMDWGSLSRFADTTMIRFGNGGEAPANEAPATENWAAVELDEGNNNILHGLTILGAARGEEAGIILSSTAAQGVQPSTVFGNVISSIHGPGILLKGTTANVVAAMNNVNGAAAGIVADREGANAILGNRFNGGPPDLTQDTRTGTLLVNRPIVSHAPVPAPPPSVPPTAVCDSGPARVDPSSSVLGGAFAASAGATRCTLTWATRLAQAPHCTASATTAGAAPFILSASATALEIGFPRAAPGDAGGGVSYVCLP